MAQTSGGQTVRQFTIRLAGLDDAPGGAALVAAGFSAYEGQYTPAAFRATTPTREEVDRRLLEGPVWVAIEGGTTVGTVSAILSGVSLHIRGMAVDPRTRRLGIGRALLQTAQ